MENIMIPSWQLPLSLSATSGCAISVLWTLESQGIAVRPAAPNAAFAPFAAAVDVDVKAVKRDRNAGMGHTRRIDAVYVPGSLAWSPPI
ncbi:MULTISPECIES: hypothetical protein [Nocardioides]|uniref:DJ-1/PfpI domain-containing protein n=1 Tax=Nocardioides vastitatis TaxID=2568655 RepID=A0ABW0ZCU8_9ACTN|nr:hypothetical protein [Nocardioides sp.]THI95616.1 hypothetical protein E7Z54_18665 [Nocardioides sp.]